MPVHAAVDHPSENARPFGAYFFFQYWVDRGWLAGERRRVEPPADVPRPVLFRAGAFGPIVVAAAGKQ